MPTHHLERARRSKHLSSIPSLVLALLLCSAHAHALDCSAIANGNWNDPMIWNNCGGATPGASDTALISNPRQITIPDGISVSVAAIEFGATGTTQSLTVTGSLVVGNVLHTVNTINGTGPITVTGTYDWTGNGSLNGGIETDGSGAQLTFAPGSQWNLSSVSVMNLRQRDVLLQGNALWSSGDIGCSSLVTMLIAEDATFEITHDGDIGSGAVDCRIRNEGTLRKSGAGAVRLTDPRVGLENHGLLDVVQGSFEFFNSAISATHSGVFLTAAGATLSAPRGATFTAASRFEGPGAVEFSGSGLRTFDGDQSFPGPVRLSGTSDLLVVAGRSLRFDAGLHWSAGRIVGPGTFRIPPGQRLLGDVGIKIIGSRAHLLIEGEMEWLGGNLSFQSSGTSPTRLTIAQGGSFDVGFRPASIAMGGGVGLLENDGSFVAIAGDGLLQISGGPDSQIVNRGSVQLSGTVRIDTSLVQESGLFLLEDAQVVVENFAGIPRPMQLQSGTLAGTGALRALLQNDAGIVAPGDIGTIGSLHVTGSYTQGASAGLAIDVAGAAAGGFDKLLIDGTPGSAELAGTLTVDRIGGFQFALGDVLPIVLAQSRNGTFVTAQLDPGFNPAPLVLLLSDAVALGLQTGIFGDGFEAVP